MKIKRGFAKGIITLIIGGTIFTLSQADIVDNFAKNTGLSQEEAQEYVDNVSEDEMMPFDELGSDLISEGRDFINLASDIDCVNYTYEWESSTLSCQKGKSQLARLGNDEIALGEAYIVLSSDSASEEDITLTINLIDKVNSNYSLEIVRNVLDFQSIDEIKKTHSFNKALLQSALESD